MYVQIADGIVEAIDAGVLVPGERLPAMRVFARQLGCGLVTVSQAYDLLSAQSRVITRVGRGTFVAQRPAPSESDSPYLSRWEPDLGRLTARGERLEGVLEELSRANAPGAISLASGHPAPETFPLADFGRALNRTLLEDPPEAMQYHAARGDGDLCQTLAAGLRERGCRVGADEIVVCSGAQQAVDLVATVLLAQGREVVASESPAYAGTLGVFDARGVTYVAVESDRDGVRVDDLARVLAEYRPRLLYVNPVAQNPTGAVLLERRARQIVELARRYDTVILEDQTGHAFTYEGSAPSPLLAHDTDGRVIVMESLSKTVFPALRIGYLAAKGPLLEALVRAKMRADSFTSTLTQRALWRFMGSAAWGRHLRHARHLYRTRRDAFIDALGRELPWANVQPPAAGITLWLPLPPRISTRAAFEGAAREGVLVMPAEPYYPTRQGPAALRLSFGDVDEEHLGEGA
ncbi:MAG: PLP-dependent aminotransferase family protein, partial [bacterium]|nr:PLP-dependent aminotransferase family protein [bacterium]